MYFCYFEWSYFQFKMYCDMGIFSFLMRPSKTHRLACQNDYCVMKLSFS